MQIDVRERAAVAMSVRGQLAELADMGSDMETMMGALAGADELGALLWRMSYGESLTSDSMVRAVALLAKRVRLVLRQTSGARGMRDRRPVAADGDIFTLLARRAIVEWVGQRCDMCLGQVVGSEPDPDHPLGMRVYSCALCGGTGMQHHRRRRVAGAKAAPGKWVQYHDAVRAQALGLPLDTYRRHWARRLMAALTLLDSCDGDAERRMRGQLRLAK